MQLRLHKRVAPTKIMLLLQVLVEMLDRPTTVARAVLGQHPAHLVDRNPPGRCLAQPLVEQTLKPFFLVAAPVTSELPLRTPYFFPAFLGGNFFPFPPLHQST